MAKVPHKKKRHFAAHLKKVWIKPDKKSVRQAAAQLTQEYGERFPDAIRCLEKGFGDSLHFYSFPEIDLKKVSSTNVSERTIREGRAEAESSEFSSQSILGPD